MQCSSLTSCSTFTPNYWAPYKCANCYKPESAHSGSSDARRIGHGRERSALGRGKSATSIDKKRSSSVYQSSSSSSDLLYSSSPSLSQTSDDQVSNTLASNDSSINEESSRDTLGEGSNSNGEQPSGKKLERRSSLARMKHMVEKMVFKRKDGSGNTQSSDKLEQRASDSMATIQPPLSGPLPAVPSPSSPISAPPPPLSSPVGQPLSSRSSSSGSSTATGKSADDLQQYHQNRLQIYKLRVLVEAELVAQFPNRSSKEIESAVIELEPHLAKAIARLIVGNLTPIDTESLSMLAFGIVSPIQPQAPPSYRTDASSAQVSIFSTSAAAGLYVPSPRASKPASARLSTSFSARSLRPSGLNTITPTEPSKHGHKNTSAFSSTIEPPPSRSTTTSVTLNSKDTNRARVVYEYDQPSPEMALHPLKDKVIVIHSMANPERWWKERTMNDGGTNGRSDSPSVSVKLLESHSPDNAGSPQLRRHNQGDHRRWQSDSSELEESGSEGSESNHDRSSGRSRRSRESSRVRSEDEEEDDLPKWRSEKLGGKDETFDSEEDTSSTDYKSPKPDRLVKSSTVPLERGNKIDTPRATKGSSRGGSIIESDRSKAKQFSFESPVTSETTKTDNISASSSPVASRNKKKSKHKNGTKAGKRNRSKTIDEGRDLVVSPSESRHGALEEDLTPVSTSNDPDDGSKRPTRVHRSASVGMEKSKKKSAVESKKPRLKEGLGVQDSNGGHRISESTSKKEHKKKQKGNKERTGEAERNGNGEQRDDQLKSGEAKKRRLTRKSKSDIKHDKEIRTSQGSTH